MSDKSRRWPPSSNTPPQARHSVPFSCGEDYFEWGVAVDWGEGWPCLLERLTRARESKADPNGVNPDAGWVSIGENELEATRKKGISPHYPYRLEHDGLLLMGITDYSAPLPGRLNVRFLAQGLACMNYGGLGCLELARNIIVDGGGEILREALSRVDIRCDLPGIAIDEFYRAALEGRYVTRSRKHRDIESDGRLLKRCQGIVFGKKPLRLSVYDKLRKIANEPDSYPHELVQERCWGGIWPRKATRVEYQVSRERLKKFGVGSPDDYFRKRGALVRYLCEDWFRFTATATKTRNYRGAATLPLWMEVARAMSHWAGESRGEVLKPLPRGPVDVSHLLKQGYGVLKRIAHDKRTTPVEYPVFERWMLEKGMHGR